MWRLIKLEWHYNFLRQYDRFYGHIDDHFLPTIMEASSSSSSVECPICHSVIPLKLANEHIDQCLHKDSSGVGGMELINMSGDKVERKRQSMLAFSKGESPSNHAKIRKIEPVAACSVAVNTR